jgi:glycosyltransferase involved in cell wall biosynthesis
MKILIDGQTLATPDIQRGIGKYFITIVEQILAADFTTDFFLYAPARANLDELSPWARRKLCVIRAPEFPVTDQFKPDEGAAKYSESVNGVIDELGIDVYWSPNGLMNNVFLPTKRATRCQFAVTIFDLIPAVMESHFEKHWPPEAFKQYRAKLKALESEYDLFFHISNHTRDDFNRLLNVSRKQHVVTPLAAGTRYRPYPFPHVVGDPYIVYPGGFDPRKNMPRALEAFAELHRKYASHQNVARTELLLVCHADRDSEIEIRNAAQALGIDNKLKLAGFVTESELVTIYQKARCLFFPSLYEGFGLPVIEGLACGQPVAASNTSSIPEVAGDFAFYFDPLNIGQMADALFQALQSPMDFESRQRRYQYSQKFSWRNIAHATLQAFTDCIQASNRNKVSAVTVAKT